MMIEKHSQKNSRHDQFGIDYDRQYIFHLKGILDNFHYISDKEI